MDLRRHSRAKTALAAARSCHSTPIRRARVALFAAGLLLHLPGASAVNGAAPNPDWYEPLRATLSAELVARYGSAERLRIERGLDQVASFWWAEDGDAATFADLVRTHYAGDPAVRDAMFTRYEYLLERQTGHLREIGREFRTQADLECGPILPIDEVFAAYDPGAHVTEDFFANHLAHVALLNFPLTTLDDRVREGEHWTRREWAETRLAQRFARRIPAAVHQEVARASSASEAYVAGYNVWMHHVLGPEGARLFPPGMRLLSHWNLRDQIKADYADGADGLARQRVIQLVMERIVTQTIPEAVIDNPHFDWDPSTNSVVPATATDFATPPPHDLVVTTTPEPHTRYAHLLGVFRAERLVDPYSPTAPTLMARRFEEGGELPEVRVRAMLEEVLSSRLAAEVGKLIAMRLGRDLEPFDIWYNGFKGRGAYTEAQLDARCRERYPTPEAYAADIPRLLRGLGFAPDRVAFLAGNIVVDPARGSGHALGAGMRSVPTRLRTRVGADGMDYKGYNIAVHEMGHNVEQTLSLEEIDHWLLHGVPSNAFTEALAFVFQARDLELLGLAATRPDAVALATLDTFWATFEISGVALVDMEVWHWMYAHPEATPGELESATLEIARTVWNRYYAPIFGVRDVTLLAVYAHMISYSLYLPDYPIGHLIAFQIEEQMREAGAIGPEFERMARFGSLTPDLWMQHATGAPVGTAALLEATGRALESLDGTGAATDR